MSRLTARLKKAETQAGIGARCASCRLGLRSTWQGFGDDLATNNSEDESFFAQCHFCQTKYRVLISASWPEWKRDVTKLSQTYKEDDFYTDKKAAAVRLYHECYVRRVAAKREASEKLAEAIERFNPTLNPKPRKSQTSAQRTQDRPLTQKVKLRQAIVDEYINDVRSKRREMRKKYGRRFPELDSLLGVLTCTHFYYYDFRKPDIANDDYLKHLQAWATLESVIWGEILPHTLEEIAQHEQALDRLAAAIDERERKQQQEREQSARERLARIEAAASPPVLVLEPPSIAPDKTLLYEKFRGTPAAESWKEFLDRTDSPYTR